MKEHKTNNFILSEESLFESAEKRYERGDYLGALTMLNKRGQSYKPSADALALYADVYEAMEIWPLAADAWFRFLDVCNEADFAEGYEGLSIAFLNLGNELQSAYYYHRALEDDEEDGEFELDDDEDLLLFDEKPSSPIRLVGDSAPDPEGLREGILLLKAGELDEAKKRLAEIDESSSDYPSAMGLSAMCTLMLGDEEGAEHECRELLERYPDNVQALTTYCAVLDARENREGAREIARRLADSETDSTDDLYRIATALCETGLDEEAYIVLSSLKTRLPNDDSILYFHAVAAYHTGRIEEAVSSLERIVTIDPSRAVAAFYLVRMRELRDGDGEAFPMGYFYRLPEDKYHAVADRLLSVSEGVSGSELKKSLPELEEDFRIAFDEMEGRDEKLQFLASKVAVRLRSDDFVRSVLLDYRGNDLVKLSVLHDLVLRNEEESYGTVFLNIYREFYTHELTLGDRKRNEFLKAFADVYSKYALLGEENEQKLCGAAEDVYATLAEAGVWGLIDARAEIAAVIYREARLRHGVRSFDEIIKMFSADKLVAQKILDYMI